MIIVKLHRQGGEVILAACDSEIFGQLLESDDLKLDMGSEFFNGQEVDENEFRGMMVQATSANLVGPRTIRLAIEEGMVHPDAVLEICGVPHAMFF